MNGARILIVDDDAAIRTVVSEALRREGYAIRAVGSIAAQTEALRSFIPELLITDVILPDGDGLAAVPAILERFPGLPIIVLSAQNTLTTAVRANEQGAFEYLPKPFDLKLLAEAVRSGLARNPIPAPRNDESPSELPMIGRSPPMQDVYRIIARVVGNDLSVLVLGESGTGKELVARAIHDLGARSKKPFVAVNMAAIPRDLIEAELFGHERGAFTGANARAIGRFEEASGGTLFLDEIGDMPMEAQTRLLRVLQSSSFTSVGGRVVQVDVRVIAATHQDLSALIQAGQFREDLYYRLNVIPIQLPPLRVRGNDIVLLARSFLDKAAAQGLSRRHLTAEAEATLIDYDWPGNVRELDNLMRRLAAISRDPVVTPTAILTQLDRGRAAAAPSLGDLEPAVVAYLDVYFAKFGGALPPQGLFRRVMAQVEKPLITAAMASVQGNQLRAAELLGINRNTLRKKLTEHALPEVDD